MLLYFTDNLFLSLPPPSQVLNVALVSMSRQAAGRRSHLALPAPSAASPHPPLQQPCPAKCPPPLSPCWGALTPQPTLPASPAPQPRWLHKRTGRTGTALAKLSPGTGAKPSVSRRWTR